jgi:predicted nucleic acid-binding protein
MERMFVDASAWLALVNRSDEAHVAVRSLLRSFAGRLVTSNFVLDETVTLCRYRLGHAVAATVGDTLLDPETVDLVRVTAADERAAWDLFIDRSDKSYSYTDCTSFVLLRRLGVEQVAALDEDFRREGFDVRP